MATALKQSRDSIISGYSTGPRTLRRNTSTAMLELNTPLIIRKIIGDLVKCEGDDSSYEVKEDTLNSVATFIEGEANTFMILSNLNTELNRQLTPSNADMIINSLISRLKVETDNYKIAEVSCRFTNYINELINNNTYLKISPAISIFMRYASKFISASKMVRLLRLIEVNLREKGLDQKVDIGFFISRYELNAVKDDLVNNLVDEFEKDPYLKGTNSYQTSSFQRIFEEIKQFPQLYGIDIHDTKEVMNRAFEMFAKNPKTQKNSHLGLIHSVACKQLDELEA